MTSQHQLKKIDFPKELEQLARPVRRTLKRYLPHGRPAGHYRMIRDYPSRGGKYLRPGLLLLATELFGGNQKDAMLAAAAIEASENWLLIHDDVEDHSLERRHKPALQMLWGDELAINAGDALHILAWKIAADAAKALGGRKGWQLLQKLNGALLTTTEGQYLELAWIRTRKIRVTEKEYFEMIGRKTAAYTFAAPLELGALIAGASQREIDAIRAWAMPLGCAFQIMDDVRNLTLSSAVQGKEFAEDILEGKRTLILSYLLAAASPRERRAVERIYRKDRARKTRADQAYVLKLIRAYASDAHARTRARMYVEKARKIFLKGTSHLSHVRARQIIAAGIDFILEGK